MSQRKLVLEYLYFHYIDKKNVKGGTLLRGGTNKLSDPEIQEIYGGHFEEVIIRGDSVKVYDLYEADFPHSKRLIKTLTQMKTATSRNMSALFKKEGPWLAELFMKNMHGNHPGVLFICRMELDGKRYVGLLKLEWAIPSWSEFDQKNEEFVIKRLTAKIPVIGGFQKGAIWPHPASTTYMRVYQEFPAIYFNDFLAGAPAVSAKTVVTETRKIALSLTGGSLSLEQSLDLYKGLSNHLGQQQKVIQKKDITRVISQVVSSTPRPQIKKVVEEKYEAEGLLKAADLENQRARFKVGDIRVLGSFRSLSEYFKEHGVRKNVHTIKGKISDFRME
jgi:hypothetical protein